MQIRSIWGIQRINGTGLFSYIKWLIVMIFMVNLQHIPVPWILWLLQNSRHPNNSEGVALTAPGKSWHNRFTTRASKSDFCCFFLLGGGFNPFEQICSSNWIISLGRGENFEDIWNHHLVGSGNLKEAAFYRKNMVLDVVFAFLFWCFF